MGVESMKNPSKIDLGGLLGPLGGGLEGLEGILGASWGPLGASWWRLGGVLVASWDHLGPS